MENKQKQLLCSAAAILLCGAFILTGKLWVFPDQGSETGDLTSSVVDLPPDPDSSADDPADTTSEPETTTTSGTSPDTTSFPLPATTTAPEQTGAQQPGTTPAQQSSTKATDSSDIHVIIVTTTAKPPAVTTSPPAPSSSDLVPAPDGYFNDALIIGDSRTVGRANYGGIKGAEYFATVGLGAYKIGSAKNEVGTTKGKSFSQVLTMKTYGKVYICLGLNELGNSRDATIRKFKDLINQIKAAQPAAIIYLEANLHVSAKRASKGDIINNNEINKFNAAIANLADNQKIFYIDANPVFDDASGAMRADYTSDGIHPYAKHYKEWSDWQMQNVILTN